MNLIAIDPGASGGIAILVDGVVEAHKMPETPRDLCDIIDAVQSDSYINGATPLKVYLEQVGGFTGEGQPGSRMFGFGQGFGEIIGILTHAKIPFETVRPQKWINALSLGTAGIVRAKGLISDEERSRIKKANEVAKRDWKNKLKERAQRLYPHLKVTLATSDALLILEYARKIENQQPVTTPQPVLAI